MRKLDPLRTGCGCAVPNFALMSLYPELIQELGGARFARTRAGKTLHRDINAAAPYCNHHDSLHVRILQVTDCRADYTCLPPWVPHKAVHVMPLFSSAATNLGELLCCSQPHRRVHLICSLLTAGTLCTLLQ
jgi:hypothetical protein